MNKKCIGCGSVLQTNNINEIGYVPIDKLLVEDNILCKRCFQLKHYGINKQPQLSQEFYRNEVKKSINNSDIVLLVVDIFDFESSMTDEILDILRENNSIILVNKIDLLPKNIVENKLIDSIKTRFLEEDIVPFDISFVSTKSVVGINGILKKITTFAKNNNMKKITASIIGVSNTGKSSIINKLIDNFGANNKKKSLVSKYSGTTIKNIRINLKYKDISMILYDTPGLIPQGRILEYFDIESSLKLIPQNRIIPTKINLKKGDVLSITKYVSFENLTEKKDKNDTKHAISFNIYTSPFVKIHKTKLAKYLELKESDFLNMTGEEQFLMNEFETYVIKVEKYNEIAISGLGFISVSNGCELKVTLPKNIKLVVREPILRVKNV